MAEPLPEESGLSPTVPIQSGSPATAPGAFAPGQVIASRWRIERVLGHGGMGDVYEATDLELHELVALKTLRRHLTGDAERDRFKREIQLARRVTHENVCRIFELGFGPDDVPFLTMELLAGETLHARLRRGPLPPREALPILSQIAQGLDAAHRAGVVHRDFKSANVMLVPRGGGVRAVVTDFGLAKGAGPAAGADIATTGGTATDAIVGTPAYMAPEQVEGGHVGPAADVYALGVVMFEMLTGKLPFVGDSPLSTAAKRLTEPAPSPRRHLPDLDPAWERTVLRCLERDPARRFSDAPAALAALSSPAPLRLRSWSWAAGLIVMTALGVWLSTRQGTEPRGAPVVPAEGRPSLALLPLHNGTRLLDDDWVGTALPRVIMAHVGADARVGSARAAAVAGALQDLGLPEAEEYDPPSIARLSTHLGCQVIVSGSYARGTAGGLDVRLNVHRPGGGSRLLTARGAVGALGDLGVKLGESLRAELGLPAPAGGAAHASGALPRSEEAARWFSRGMRSIHRGDLAGAAGMLERSRDLEPDFPWVRLALTDLRRDLRQVTPATGEAFEAAALAPRLPRAWGRVADALARHQMGDGAGAVESLRCAYEESPTVEIGIWLARIQGEVGAFGEARATVDELLRQPPPEGTEPYLGILSGYLTLDMEQRLLSVRRVAADAERRGRRRDLAQALSFVGWAEFSQGRMDAAMEAVDRARQIHAELGERLHVGDDLNVLAAIGWQRGRHREAAAYIKESVATFRELHAPDYLAYGLGNLGIILQGAGDAREAQACFDEAKALGSQQVPALGLGLLHLGAGEIPAARESLREAIAVEPGEVLVRGYAIAAHASLLAAAGEAAAAEAGFDEALAVLQAGGFRAFATGCRLGKAALLVDRGRLTEAEALAKDALREAEGLGAAHFQSRAHVQLARIERGRGDLAAAGTALEAAAALSGRHDDWATEASRLLEQARLLGARSDARTGRSVASGLREDAIRRGMALVALEAELLLAELDADGADARAVAARAESIGYRRLARQAAAAAGR